MRRNWIVVGDPTSSSGQVITGSPFTDIAGAAVAREGDHATCPLHQGIFTIVRGDPTLIVDGQPVALDGALLSCGCKVLATKQDLVFVDDGQPEQPANNQAAPPAFVDPAHKPAVCIECLLAAAQNAAPLLVRA